MAEVGCDTAGFGACCAGLEGSVGEERLKAELKSDVRGIGGDDTAFAGAGAGLGAAGAEENALKPSSANRSFGIDGAAGLDAGAGGGDDVVNEKSSILEG